jgi:hypothetical protein
MAVHRKAEETWYGVIGKHGVNKQHSRMGLHSVDISEWDGEGILRELKE